MSLLASKGGDTVVVVENITALYRSEKNIVKAVTVDGKVYNLGLYRTSEQADAAIFNAYETLKSGKGAQLPSDAKVEQIIRARQVRDYQGSNGHKPKGHGGS